MRHKSEKSLLVGVLSAAFALAAEAESSAGNGLGGIPIPPAPTTSVGQIVVFEDATKGPVKPVNGVNGAPHKVGTPAFAGWKRLEIPYGRTHDFGLIPSYGGTRSVDIASIFRDFAADENDPASYDFANTDMILRRMRDGGGRSRSTGWAPNTRGGWRRSTRSTRRRIPRSGRESASA